MEPVEVDGGTSSYSKLLSQLSDFEVAIQC